MGSRGDGRDEEDICKDFAKLYEVMTVKMVYCTIPAIEQGAADWQTELALPRT